MTEAAVRSIPTIKQERIASIRQIGRRIGCATVSEIAAMNDRLEALNREYHAAVLRRFREIERAARHMDRVMNADLGSHESRVISEAATWLADALAGRMTPDPDLQWWQMATRKQRDDDQ
jgi:hypothetical protein